MRFLKNSLAAFASLLIFMSCSKATPTTPSEIGKTPSNLSLSAVVATDGSGNVSFTATADNAASFTYEYGNGIIETIANGTVNYRYGAIGTNLYKVTVTAKGATGLTAKKSLDINVTVVTNAATLIWSDEFNIDGAPDSKKWGYDIGTGSGGWGNNELEYYTNRTDNAVVSGGILKIIAKKEAYAGSNYTSARLLTKDKFSFKYGKVEARAKLPAGVGTWPAIWMLGNNINTVSWPVCGEIDIMEHIGVNLNKIYGTLHHPGHSGGNADGKTVMISNATTEFHKYTMEWNEISIKFAVDDTVFYTFTNNASLPFNQNFFLLLNFAMGGNFGGAVDPAFSSATFEIDYIRVYQ